MTTNLIVCYESGSYLDTCFNGIALLRDLSTGMVQQLVIENIEVCVTKLDRDEKWWIIPDQASNDAIFNAIGPFDDLIVCMSMARLSATRIYMTHCISGNFDIIATDV